jgi:hypothetical protein
VQEAIQYLREEVLAADHLPVLPVLPVHIVRGTGHPHTAVDHPQDQFQEAAAHFPLAHPQEALQLAAEESNTNKNYC